MYCHLEFKLCYLKKLKLFSIIIKELFEVRVLQGEKADMFYSCQKYFLKILIFV